MGLAAVVALVASFGLELDAALRIGDGQVTGRIAWFDDRGARSAYGHVRAKGSWPTLVVTNEAGEPIRYFHSFMPGVYRELYDLIKARRDAEAPVTYPVSNPLVDPKTSSINRPTHLPHREPYVRLRYAGLGRKSVYAFEELPSPP